jgi:hypothetical protein
MFTTSRRGRTLCALTAATLALGGAAGAQAATNPELDVTADGTAIFAFEDENVVQGRAWEKGVPPGPFETIETLPSAHQHRMAANDAGQAAFIWTRTTADGYAVLEGRRREADGTYGPVLKLTKPGNAPDEPRVAIAPNGAATFIWQGGEYTIARHLTADGALGPKLVLSAANYQARSHDVAMDAAGAAIVVWSLRDYDTEAEVAQARRIKPDGTVGTTKTLGFSSPVVKNLDVELDGAGRAVIAWLQRDGTVDRPTVRVRYPNGTYSGIDTLTDSGPSARALDLAVAPDGDATVVWARTYDASQLIEMRERAADGTVGPLRSVSQQAGVIVDDPKAAADPVGGAYLIWRQRADQTDSAPIVLGRRRTPAGSLSAIQQFSVTGDHAYSASVGVDDEGDATVGWEMLPPGQSSLYEVQARRRLVSSGVLTQLRTIAKWRRRSARRRRPARGRSGRCRRCHPRGRRRPAARRRARPCRPAARPARWPRSARRRPSAARRRTAWRCGSRRRSPRPPPRRAPG